MVPALWFLGLTDIRWRAAELFRQRANWAGELKSSGGSTTEETETETGKGLVVVWATDLMGAGLRAGESGRQNGCNIVWKDRKIIVLRNPLQIIQDEH